MILELIFPYIHICSFALSYGALLYLLKHDFVEYNGELSTFLAHRFTIDLKDLVNYIRILK